jgi:hypothetical protein
MDYFTLFTILITILIIGVFYLALSYSKQQIVDKEKHKDVVYRADQRFILNVSVIAFWGLILQAVYTIVVWIVT